MFSTCARAPPSPSSRHPVTHLDLAYAAPTAALLSRQKPLLFIPGFFQKDDDGTDPLRN